MLCSAQFLAVPDFFPNFQPKPRCFPCRPSATHPTFLGFHQSHLSWPWARAPKGWTSRCTSEFLGFGRRPTLVCLKLRYSTEFNGLLSSSPLKCLYGCLYIKHNIYVLSYIYKTNTTDTYYTYLVSVGDAKYCSFHYIRGTLWSNWAMMIWVNCLFAVMWDSIKIWAIVQFLQTLN